ncbi:hypothetical protein BH10PAT1_BH10PAT1_5070 [soil metagenome]
MKYRILFLILVLMLGFCSKVEANTTRSNLRADGTILLDGQPFFPFGFFHTTSLRDGNCFISDLNTMADAGFNTVVSYIPSSFTNSAQHGCGTGIQSVPDSVFSTASARGVYLFPLADWSTHKDIFNILSMQNSVGGWGIGDDANRLIGGSTTLSNINQSVKQASVNQPRITIAAIEGHPNSVNFNDYYGSSDVLMTESYPVGNLYQNGYQTEEEQSLAYYANTRDGLKQGSATTFLAIPQTFAWPGPRSGTDVSRYPTSQELRNMMYGAFIYGAKGAVMYAFLSSEMYPKTLVTASSSTWNETKAMKQDLFDKSELTQVFMNGKFFVNSKGRTWYEPSNYSYKPSSGPGIFAGVWSYNNTFYVIILSTFSDVNSTKSANISLPSDLLGQINSEHRTMVNVFQGDSRYGSGMSYNFATGSITGNILGQGVHVYAFNSSGSQIFGDANHDGIVDNLDYLIWVNKFGQNMTGIINGDFNNDGKVDGVDYVVWLNNFGK